MVVANPRVTGILSLLIFLVMATACTGGGTPVQDEEFVFDRQAFLALLDRPTPPAEEELKAFYRQPGSIPYRTQGLTNIEAIRGLGEQLFFDPRLSKSGLMSCATCHNPSLGWVDGLPRSIENATRRSMSLYNLAWDHQFTWTGRAQTLMSQAVLALTAGSGMAGAPDQIVARLRNTPGYHRRFEEIFQTSAVPPEHRISVDTVVLALEIFVASIRSPEAPFDRWISGDIDAISAEARAGFLLFNTRAGCARCHNSWRFSDSEVYDIGLDEDPGRAEFLPADPRSPFAFKAVGLREIAGRPPYMHSGVFPSLETVIDFYDRGGNVNRPSKSPFVRPLGLSAGEKRSLRAFLETLSSEPRPYPLPPLPQ